MGIRLSVHGVPRSLRGYSDLRSRAEAVPLPDFIPKKASTTRLTGQVHRSRRDEEEGKENMKQQPTRNRPPRRSAAATPPDEGRAAVTVPEAAWLLHASPNSIWALIRSGELPSFKLGRKRLVARSEVDAFIERGMANGGES